MQQTRQRWAVDLDAGDIMLLPLDADLDAASTPV
jgi:hypothetical protein